jgi:hypothetical protein
MNWPAYLAHGGAVDLILAVMVIEYLALAPRQAAPERRMDLLIALLPGLFLVLALRAALTGAPILWIAGCLAASFPVHLLDLRRRGLLR